MHAKKSGTSCAVVLFVSPASASASASSRVFPENFLSQSSSDHTEIESTVKNRSKDLSTCQNKYFHASPGLEEPSLILIGLAMLTRIVRPKSSDSFCKRRAHRSTRAVWTIATVEEGKKAGNSIILFHVGLSLTMLSIAAAAS